MAAVREELSLVDKFSQGFNRFISMAGSAAGSSKAAQQATKSYETTAKAAGSALAHTAVPMKNFASAAQNGGETMEQALFPLKNYESVANSLQKKLIGLTAQWDALIQEQDHMVVSGQESTEEFAKLDSQIVALAGKLTLVEAQLNSVTQQMAQAGQATREISEAEQNAANVASQYADNIVQMERDVSGVVDELEDLTNEFDEVSQATTQAEKKQNLFIRVLKGTGKAVGGLIGKLASLGKQSKAAEGLDKQFRRFALTLFSVSRIINTLKNALEYAPQSVQDSWNILGTSIKQSTYGGIIAALQAIQPHLDALNEKLNSPAGQKFSAGMIMIGNVIGSVIGFALDMFGSFVDFIGNNFSTIMTIAAVVVGIFAAQMLLSAAATMAANLPLLLLIGIVAAVIMGLQQMGMTSEEIFTGIGEIVGWLYAFVYNIVADIWNLVASFGEFFAGFLDNPVAAIIHLIADMADTVLGILETIAGAIDSIFGSNLSAAVNGWRSSVQGWANDLVGEKSVKIQRMEKISYTDAMKDFGGKFGDFGKQLDNFDLDFGDILGSVDVSGIGMGNSIGGIGDSVGGSLGSDVGAIKKEVQMSEEDLKSLVDLAERQYVNNINLTSQTPVINVSGQNTGNTAADRRALANAIRDILLEQKSAASFRSTAQPT